MYKRDLISKMETNQDILSVIPGLTCISYERMNVINNYQRLWTQLAEWMREYFHDEFEDSPDVPAVIIRLFEKLPLDFYNTFRIFYGPEISQLFLNNFSNFLTSAWQLILGYKNNDRSAIDSSTIRWYQSADELSNFLGRINIFWDANQWRYLLYQYINLKIQQIISYLSGDYEQEIIIYDRIEDLAILMGSYMARGIIAIQTAPPPEINSLQS